MTDLERILPLLDLIASVESESAAKSQGVKNGYDVVHSIAHKTLPPPRKLTSLSVNDVLSWQAAAIKKYRADTGKSSGFSAAGRYQIIRKTLMGLVSSSKVSLTDTFNARVQDQCALALLRQNGYQRWVTGGMTDDSFAALIANIWASFPTASGKSAYHGDAAGNKALIGYENVLNCLRQVKGAK